MVVARVDVLAQLSKPVSDSLIPPCAHVLLVVRISQNSGTARVTPPSTSRMELGTLRRR